MTSILRGIIGHGMRSAHVYSVGGRSVIGRSAIRPILATAGVARRGAIAGALAQAVQVNGELITDYDIEQRTKGNSSRLAKRKSLPPQGDHRQADRRQTQGPDRPPPQHRPQKGGRRATTPTSRSACTSAPSNSTRELHEGGITAATLKAKILADMSWRTSKAGRRAAKAGIGYDPIRVQPISEVHCAEGNAALLEARRKDADAPTRPARQLRSRADGCTGAAGRHHPPADHEEFLRPCAATCARP